MAETNRFRIAYQPSLWPNATDVEDFKRSAYSDSSEIRSAINALDTFLFRNYPQKSAAETITGKWTFSDDVSLSGTHVLDLGTWSTFLRNTSGGFYLQSTDFSSATGEYNIYAAGGRLLLDLGPSHTSSLSELRIGASGSIDLYLNCNKLGFYGHATTTRQSAGTTISSRTAGAAYGATEQTMLQEAHDTARLVQALLKATGLGS